MKHLLKRDRSGNIDLFAWDYDNWDTMPAYGPVCLACDDRWCHCCEPDRLHEECPGRRAWDSRRWERFTRARRARRGYHQKTRRRARRQR